MQLPSSLRNLFEPALLAELDRRAEHRRVPEGQALLEPGQMVRTVPIVISGLVKVSRIEPDGRELFLYYVNPEETCAMTFTCCMESQPSEIRALAEEDVELLAVPVQVMDEWLAKYPSWKSFVMRTIRARFNELLRTIDLIAFQNLDQRLAAFLREKARAQASSLINLSHEAVANELATSRVVVSRLLKKLERDGKVLLFRNQIKLLGEL
ncbi:MAG: Crp/Fnr family transcriptional regulator [Fibrobacteres bacterium]|jgi:CRP/FNR family transcriptional regulator|nr:Crp/Fnr family transcriptional regulator [Fibrobacterota bacterium]